MVQLAQHKIIFTGPVGSGKTTAISSLSDVPILRTDEFATDMTLQRKPQTTVAMDYGVLKMGSEKVHLYGTPGQERFDFMWEILREGAIGLVLMLDHSRPTPLQDLTFYVSAFRQFIDETQLAVGITHMDDQRAMDRLDCYNETLTSLGITAPVFEVDARNRRDIGLLVQALLFSIDPQLSIHD